MRYKQLACWDIVRVLAYVLKGIAGLVVMNVDVDVKIIILGMD